MRKLEALWDLPQLQPGYENVWWGSRKKHM
jgi:hypothetical protein